MAREKGKYFTSHRESSNAHSRAGTSRDVKSISVKITIELLETSTRTNLSELLPVFLGDGNLRGGEEKKGYKTKAVISERVGEEEDNDEEAPEPRTSEYLANLAQVDNEALVDYAVASVRVTTRTNAHWDVVDWRTRVFETQSEVQSSKDIRDTMAHYNLQRKEEWKEGIRRGSEKE
jgi:hypothetical protein